MSASIARVERGALDEHLHGRGRALVEPERERSRGSAGRRAAARPAREFRRRLSFLAPFSFAAAARSEPSGVEPAGLEPATFWLPARRSPS